MERLRGEFRDDISRNGDTADLFGVVLAACRPDTGFPALDRKFPADRKPMLDVEARAAERAHPGCYLDRVAESDGLDEIGARVDQGNADDAESAGEVLRLHAERRLEHVPGVGVEDLEEAAVENDAGRIALAPFDGQLPAVGERHACCLRSCCIGRYNMPPPSTAHPRESGGPGAKCSGPTLGPRFPLSRE